MKIFALLGVIVMLTTAVLNMQAEPPAQEEFLLVVNEVENISRITDEEHKEIEIPDIEIRLMTADGLQTVFLEEYLHGVVLSEMLPGFHAEALKAQAVAARTFAVRMLESNKHEQYDLCTYSGCCQAWKSEAQLRQSLGSAYAEAAERVENAVKETSGEVITYQNKLIEAVYYSCSGGSSEPAVAVWGSEVPYLQAVESPGEENAAAFSSTVQVSLESFREIVQSIDADIELPVLPQDWFGEIRRSAGGGVMFVMIGGQKISGSKMRQAFGLKSTNFTPVPEAGKIIFHVKGYGHRVGMSQYGADAMGRNGKTYSEIILHYYSGVSIKKLSRTESGQLVWN